jgi:hypothetical protein
MSEQSFEYRLVRIDDDLTAEEVNLDPKTVQAISTCLRMGLPVAPRAMRPKLQGLREFLNGLPFEQVSGLQESQGADDE